MKLERHHTIFDGTIISDCAEFEFRNVRSRFIHSSWRKVSYSVNVEKKPRIELWLNLWNNETLNWTLIETLMNVLFSLTQLRWGSMILRDELMILMSIFRYNHLPTSHFYFLQYPLKYDWRWVASRLMRRYQRSLISIKSFRQPNLT